MALYNVYIGSKEYQVEISDNQSKVNGKTIQAGLRELREKGFFILQNGVRHREVYVHSEGKNQYAINTNGRFAVARVEKKNGFSTRKAIPASSGSISAPISGIVVAVNIRVGDKVSEGETLLILESMKMQMMIKSPCTGSVLSVDVKPGSQVTKGETLVRLKETKYQIM